MSKQSDDCSLDLDKCIVSRLWYTVATIFRHHTDTGDFGRLRTLIGSCSQQGLDEHRWIAKNLLSQLDNNEETKKSLTQEEFASCLKLLDTQIPSATKEEILKLFESVRTAEEKNDVPACELSQESLQCLETNLLTNPTLTHWVIDGLLCIWLPVRFAQSDSALQDVYFASLKKMLNSDGNIENVESSISRSSEKNKNSLELERLGVLLSILSKIELTEAKEDELLNWLFPALLNHSNCDDIELALYSRKKSKFFKAWHNFLDDTYARSDAADCFENAGKISASLFNLNENSTTCLNAIEIFKRSLRRQKHWLMDIFEICYEFLIHDHYEEVEKILENPVLGNFWLILLFKLLSDCPNEPIYSPENSEKSSAISRALKFLLEKSENSFHEDPSLERLKVTVKSHLEVLDWILQWKNRANFTVKQVLHLLNTHSILAALKITTNIHENSFDEISYLLKDTKDSKNVFRAYRAMLSALKAILLSEYYNLNHQKVAEQFDDMEKSLGNIFPLEMRLEVLENIFSMLFLRYEDFVDADSGSDAAEEDIPEKPAISKSETGFFCNKYAMRETLDRLKRSIVAAEFELAEQKIASESSKEYLKKGLKSISKALADANWRLELLTSTDFIGKTGNPDLDMPANLKRDSTNFHDDRPANRGLTMKTIFYRPNESSSDESEFTKSDPDGSSEASSLGNNAGTKRRKKLRKYSTAAEKTTTRKRERTLNCMLATNESLVLQCLWKSDYERASQVIEMFGLKNTRLEGEILFSKAMRGFRKDMRNQWANSDTVDAPDFARQQSTLENLRKAVKEGFHASRSTSQVETFLASQESSVRLLSTDSMPAKEILTMASLDLALTMSRTHQDSLNLSGVSMNYLKSCKNVEISGYSNFFSGLHRSLYENNSESSLSEILCNAKMPLCSKKAKEKMLFWSRLFEKLLVFKKIDNFDFSNEENSTNSLLLEISTICENGELYLPRIDAHLKLLHTITPEENLSLSQENFNPLNMSIDAYIGDRIFRLNSELDEVETIASTLQVNLVHSILVNCCPKLPFQLEKSSGIVESEKNFTILNKEKSASVDFDNLEANECVRGILSELLDALRQFCCEKSSLEPPEAAELARNPEIRRILDKTKNLAKIDLSALSFGSATLAFFLNVWNLMFVHAILDFWSLEAPIDDLRREIAFTTFGYEIGDLGPVSFDSLRSKLLGESSWKPRYFESCAEELNEQAWQDLDVPFEPKVIFAMINEFQDSPIVRSYSKNSLIQELEASAKDYLNFHDKKVPPEASQEFPELINRFDALNSKKSADHSPKIANDEAKKCWKTLIYSYNIRFNYTEEKSTDPSDSRAKNRQEIDWRSRIVKPSLLQYLEGHCWLLSYLLQRIHEESPTILDNSCEIGRTAALENFFNSDWTNNLAYLHEENRIVAALRTISVSNRLWHFFQTLLLDDETEKCLKIVKSLPDSMLQRSVELQRFKDLILADLVSKSADQFTVSTDCNDILCYVYQIRDEQILVKLILSKATDFPTKIGRQIISHLLSHVNKNKLPEYCKSRLNETNCRLEVLEKMMTFCVDEKKMDNCWHDLVQQTGTRHPVEIVRSLIDAKQFELCLEWLEYQAISSEIHSLVTQDLLIGLLKTRDEDFKQAIKLLRALPIKKSVGLCRGVIAKLESIPALRFVVTYLLENSADGHNYKKELLGIDILEQLDFKEIRTYVQLIVNPLLMLEQLLMNYRLDSLQRILAGMRERNGVEGYSEKFDETVRFYANKSLDFRVAVSQNEIERVKDNSVSSGKSQSDDFVMPLNVPTKDEWVPNDKARECSCCRVVIFTMFNRRHHCRRCGRVVCATCSPQRMRLPSYPNSVAVRVCNDCKRQMVLQIQAAQGAPSTPSSSETFDCWRLTLDENHNKTLRDEFSFENAPNISLCLAILNLHSDHEAYSNFLLDRCDDMKDLLRPDMKGRLNPEVDHVLIIKMIRSLLLAAKVKFAELGLNTGLTHCDRFLSQVDLINTLINSDCSSLIPRTDKDDNLQDHTLSRLRDLLTEREQWIIALEVSTKTGLDTQGVWAAWGSACLKAGYYERARDKFAHCLEKVLSEDSEDWVLLSYPGETSSDRFRRFRDSANDDFPSETNSRKINSKEGLKNRPNKDPPLLTEILQILDKMNHDYYSQNSKTRNNNAQEILKTLNSLKSISQGQYLQGNNGGKNFRYQESLYYLLMYGSFSSILDFFVRHQEYDKCLAYVLENDVENDLFMSVFMKCLRNGCMMEFCEAMRAKDSSLGSFRKYLMYICHCLERKGLLNTLHQLQLFMKDFVRAAMTCIRFYVGDANSYVDLNSRSHILVEAQKHLESELQLESFVKKRRKSVSSSISGQSSLTLEMDPAEIDRHMNTISRQMEIAKFLGKREEEGQSVTDFMNKLSWMDSEGMGNGKCVPTLFGNQQEKTHLAVLAILCGRDVEEGFGIAFRIMQDYNLRQQKIYSLVGHMLALEKKVNSIEQLIKCCRSSGAPNSNAISDRVLAHCVKLLLDRSRTDSNPSPKDQIDALIRIITDVELKIESYIESRQLKAAYLLAVKHSRPQDIRKILKEADRLGQLAIKSICTKWLQQTQGT